MSAVAGRRPMHVGGLSDEELVRLARNGDKTAFDTIVRRYRAPLVGYCRRWLDAHRAEEVVQHTLMKAFLCVRDDERPLNLRPWLYRVAHNAALNALEKKGSDWEQLDENYDGVPQPPQVAEQRARFLRVVDGIEALPERQREALLLNEFEGRCYADIALELGTSESGVRGLLRRARRQLREVAAVLVPLPALRELLRADAGRLHVDRAGELLGTAGAAGGVGVAGGVATKVAAGVLAAGTIAGGGTAIEHQRDTWSAPAREAPRAVVAATAAPVAALTLVPAVERGSEKHVSAPPLVPSDMGDVIGAGDLPFGGHTGVVALGGIEAHAREDSLETADSVPPVAATPVAPVSEEPRAPASPDDAPARARTAPKENTASGPSAGTPPESQPAGETGASAPQKPPADESAPPPAPPPR